MIGLGINLESYKIWGESALPLGVILQSLKQISIFSFFKKIAILRKSLFRDRYFAKIAILQKSLFCNHYFAKIAISRLGTIYPFCQ
jgi:hypothetical protein